MIVENIKSGLLILFGSLTVTAVLIAVDLYWKNIKNFFIELFYPFSDKNGVLFRKKYCYLDLHYIEYSCNDGRTWKRIKSICKQGNRYVKTDLTYVHRTQYDLSGFEKEFPSYTSIKHFEKTQMAYMNKYNNEKTKTL